MSLIRIVFLRVQFMVRKLFEQNDIRHSSTISDISGTLAGPCTDVTTTFIVHGDWYAVPNPSIHITHVIICALINYAYDFLYTVLCRLCMCFTCQLHRALWVHRWCIFSFWSIQYICIIYWSISYNKRYVFPFPSVCFISPISECNLQNKGIWSQYL